jgi:two-component system chemotaxis response regulator CheY
MRVLVADDDRVSRMAVEALFAARPGVETVSVDSGQAAWDAVRQDPRFDLLCLDVRMPSPTGIELSQRLRASPEYEQLPIVLVTSASDRETVMAATRLQVQGFIVKPVGEDAAERLSRVIAAFDATVLEPEAMAVARLGIDSIRYAKYLEAFAQQVRTLAQQSGHLEQHDSALTFQHRCGVCRNAAEVMGARRVERLLADAMREATEAPQRAETAMQLAAYWLDRVRRTRQTAQAA